MNEVQAKFSRDYLGYREGNTYSVPGGLAETLARRGLCEIVPDKPKPKKKAKRASTVRGQSGNGADG